MIYTTYRNTVNQIQANVLYLNFLKTPGKVEGGYGSRILVWHGSAQDKTLTHYVLIPVRSKYQQ